MFDTCILIAEEFVSTLRKEVKSKIAKALSLENPRQQLVMLM